jgi:hypothetical protein
MVDLHWCEVSTLNGLLQENHEHADRNRQQMRQRHNVPYWAKRNSFVFPLRVAFSAAQASGDASALP